MPESILKRIYDKFIYLKIINSQADLSNKLGVTEGYISRLLKKSEPLPNKIVKKLIDVYDLSSAFLLTGEGEMFNKDIAISKKLYTGDGKALYDEVFKQKLTQIEAQEKLGISRGTLYNYYESAVLKDDVKNKIAISLNVPYREIFPIKYTNKEESQAEKRPNYNYNNTLTLASLPFFDHDKKKINNEVLERILPDYYHSNGYVPYVNSLNDLINQYSDLEMFVEDGKNNFWPAHSVPDEIYRVPHTIANLAIPAPSRKTMNHIEPGSTIFIQFAEIDDALPEYPYLVLFKNREYCIYYISDGSKPGFVKLTCDKKDIRKEISIDKILAIFIVRSSFNQH